MVKNIVKRNRPMERKHNALVQKMEPVIYDNISTTALETESPAKKKNKKKEMEMIDIQEEVVKEDNVETKETENE